MLLICAIFKGHEVAAPVVVKLELLSLYVLPHAVLGMKRLRARAAGLGCDDFSFVSESL